MYLSHFYFKIANLKPQIVITNMLMTFTSSKSTLITLCSIYPTILISKIFFINEK